MKRMLTRNIQKPIPQPSEVDFGVLPTLLVDVRRLMAPEQPMGNMGCKWFQNPGHVDLCSVSRCRHFRKIFELPPAMIGVGTGSSNGTWNNLKAQVLSSWGDAAAVAARSALWHLADLAVASANESGTVVLSSCSHRCQEPNAIGAVVHRPVEVLMAASEDYQDSVALRKKEGRFPHRTYLAHIWHHWWIIMGYSIPNRALQIILDSPVWKSKRFQKQCVLGGETNYGKSMRCCVQVLLYSNMLQRICTNGLYWLAFAGCVSWFMFQPGTADQISIFHDFPLLILYGCVWK